MISFLQWVFLVCVVVAVAGLFGGWWALMLAGWMGFVTSVQWERRRGKAG